MAEEKSTREVLSFSVVLADLLVESAQAAESLKFDCSGLSKQAAKLGEMLRSTARRAASIPSLYERPVVAIVNEVSGNLSRALTLFSKCDLCVGLRQVFDILSAADFRKASYLLENSIADINWLLSILDSDTNLSLPPIASHDPILAWVWSFIASVQMGPLQERVEAANELASLAGDNGRYKEMIVKEGGIAPLLKLFKEGASPQAQIAAATALYNLRNVSAIVQFLGDSSITRVQVSVVNAVSKMVESVSRMVEMDPDVREEFGRENVARPLITLLSSYTALDDPGPQLHKEMAKNNTFNDNTLHSASSSTLHLDGGSSSTGGHHRLKISCAEALWKLSKGSLLNSQNITKAKGLICLANLIEEERGELQINCLMTVMELAAVAESNADLRRAAFKSNYPIARALLDQLLKVINEQSNQILLIPAIKSIGSLAKIFTAKEKIIIGSLVALLAHRHAGVTKEATIALGKFVRPGNFNCEEHSMAIIEFDGVPRLMNLLMSGNDQDQVHELVLLCYLAINVYNSKALEEARALDILKGTTCNVLAQNPVLRELFARAIHNLTLYQAAHRQAYAL